MSATPRPWHHTQGPAPAILGITLHRPWSWAFFYGGPGMWKDVENRRANFPEVPAGTWLALHNGVCWDSAAEQTIQQRLPGTTGLLPENCPAGYIVGAVQVRRLMRSTENSGSRWRLPWEVGIWLEDRRILLPAPIPCPRGWFGAWHLPPDAYGAVAQSINSTRGWLP